MKNKTEVNCGVQWDDETVDDYEGGLIIGRHMAEHFLTFMGSGHVDIYNVMLPALMSAWSKIFHATDIPETRHYLEGQKDGFLGRLSEFLVGAAYMNNCGLSEDNEYNPALIKKPAGLH